MLTRLSTLLTSLEKTFDFDNAGWTMLSEIANGTRNLTKGIVQGWVKRGVGIHEIIAALSCAFIEFQKSPLVDERMILCDTAVSNSHRVRSNGVKCKRLIQVLRGHKNRCYSSLERSFIRIALAACGEKHSIAKLSRQCDHPDALIQWYSIQCLRVVGTRRCNKALSRALQACQGTVARCEIAAVLIRSGCNAGIPVLKSELANQGLRGHRVCFIAFVLAWAGVEEGVSAVRHVCEGQSDTRIAGRMRFLIESYAATSQKSRHFFEEMQQILAGRGIEAV